MAKVGTGGKMVHHTMEDLSMVKEKVLEDGNQAKLSMTYTSVNIKTIKNQGKDSTPGATGLHMKDTL